MPRQYSSEKSNREVSRCLKWLFGEIGLRPFVAVLPKEKGSIQVLGNTLYNMFSTNLLWELFGWKELTPQGCPYGLLQGCCSHGTEDRSPKGKKAVLRTNHGQQPALERSRDLRCCVPDFAAGLGVDLVIFPFRGFDPQLYELTNSFTPSYLIHKSTVPFGPGSTCSQTHQKGRDR